VNRLDELANTRKQWGYIAVAAGLAFPAFLMKWRVFGTLEPEPAALETVLFGVSILGAAFLLSWGAEVAQLDISQGLAIAFLAFVAVLPEYAVDLVFTWKAGADDGLAQAAGSIDPCVAAHSLGRDCNRELAIANMTGANRLLIGIGWAAVVLVWWKRSGEKKVVLPPERAIDLGFLLLATIWALSIVIRQTATIFDTVVLVGMFVWYMWHTAKEEAEHPELIGPPVAIAALGNRNRRIVTLAMFLFAAAAILLSAEPFADGLVHVGTTFGYDEFLLVQWLAPLASEAPEMIIAILFVLRAKPQQGLGALVSSKVNQWTLLVGTLPLVYAISFGSATQGFHLSGQQVDEVLLTAAQSLFALAVVASLSIGRGEAIALLGLFLGQFAVGAILSDPSELALNTAIRHGFSATYFLLFLALLFKQENRVNLWVSVRRALSKPGAR